MKLLTLAKKLDFTTELQYFDYCLDSYINGNFTQCRELFKAMNREDKKGLIDYLKDRDINSVDNECREFYISLLSN